jgi:hypothetical protein
MTKVFPLLMAGESFMAAVVYAVQKDWRHASYWFFAGCIAISVTI